MGDINLPRPIVCICHSWPSQLITALSLKLKVEAAYVPSKFHFVISPFKHNIALHNLGSVGVILSSLPPNCIYLLSGSHNFVESFLKNPKFPSAWSIVHTEIPFRDYPGSELHKRVDFCTNKYGAHGLGRCFYMHFELGGATDAQYTVGVGSSADPNECLRRSKTPGIRRLLLGGRSGEVQADTVRLASPFI